MTTNRLVRSVGPKLLPFLISSFVYFALQPQKWEPSPYRIFFKCLPIVSLCFFVLSYYFSIKKRYSSLILVGLILSCFGDACLIYCENFFIHGLIFFAMAHLTYILAFGISPVKWSVLCVCSFLGVFTYLFMLPGLQNEMIFLAGLYIVLIITMAWRAVARLQVFEKMWTWTKICATVGAILFCISDFVLAVNKFRYPVPYNTEIIMGTYYTAQLGLALSVVELSRAEENVALKTDRGKKVD
ncbi:lysoplasmalogenase-like protein TMEM86A isoform X1 [Anneissia japonica]|uniref:lysoplasmalogenase-like protein TMEM86A isoform X1 n=1 Tax=Anneissia japonica TaxID=1529436 RepID=UPI001425A054|nr:lysoplasmalogenase-like protein TMEM86A isoform X1 [Anneissia japonica]